MPKAQCSFVEIVLVAFVSAALLAIISAFQLPRADAQSAVCSAGLATVRDSAQHSRTLTLEELRDVAFCIKHEASMRSRARPEVNTVAGTQLIEDGCFVLLVDGVLLLWYRPTTAFGGTVLYGDATSVSSGTYVGLPPFFSIGSIDFQPPLTVYTFFGVALLTSGIDSLLGFWFPDCGIDPPIWLNPDFSPNAH